MCRVSDGLVGERGQEVLTDVVVGQSVSGGEGAGSKRCQNECKFSRADHVGSK